MKETTLPAFKANCQFQLMRYNIGALRAYASEIGVPRATEKKKGELIEDITAILSGEREPIAKTNLGAPVKNGYVDPTLISEMESLRRAYFPERYSENGEAFDFVAECVKLQNKDKEFVFASPLLEEGETELPEEKTYIGQYETVQGVPCVLPLSGNRAQKEKIIIPNDVIERYELVEGDVVHCTVRKAKTAYVVTGVSVINDCAAGTITRVRFEDAEVEFPMQPICFDNTGLKDGRVSVRTLQWLIRVRRGQRGCIISAPKAGKTSLILDMARATLLNNRDVWLFVLLLDQTPETVAQFKKELPNCHFMCTTYEDDCDAQVFAAEFLLKRAKRFAECGKNVLLFVDSFSALARAYNETDASMGGKMLAGGLESKTVYYLKNFLGSARNLKEKGSLTMIGSLTADTGNPMDEKLLAEITSVSNLEIYLSQDLAIKHIFPNYDLMKCRSFDERFPDEKDDSLSLGDFLKREYLPYYSLESLWLMLAECKTYEEAYHKAWKAVKKAKAENND